MNDKSCTRGSVRANTPIRLGLPPTSRETINVDSSARESLSSGPSQRRGTQESGVMDIPGYMRHTSAYSSISGYAMAL